MNIKDITLEQEFSKVKGSLLELFRDINKKSEERVRIRESFLKYDMLYRESASDLFRMKKDFNRKANAYYTQVANRIIQATDTDAYTQREIIGIVKAHVTQSTGSGIRIGMNPNIYDFIIYAVIRGKPWDDSLSANTRFFSDRHMDDKRILNTCHSRLAAIISHHLIKCNQDLILSDKDVGSELVNRLMSSQMFLVNKLSSHFREAVKVANFICADDIKLGKK